MDPLQGVSDIQSPMPEAVGNTSQAAWRGALADASFQQMTMSADAAVPKPDPWRVVGGGVGGVVGGVIVGGAGCVGGAAGGTLVAPGVGTVGGAAVGCEEGVVVGGAVGAGIGYGIGAGVHGVVHWVENRGHSPVKPPHDATDPTGAKAPGKPGEAEGFVDPKGGPKWVANPNPRRGGSSHGWLDAKGRVWCPTGQGGRAHGGPHWDVQLPNGRHVNVGPGQNIDDLL